METSSVIKEEKKKEVVSQIIDVLRKSGLSIPDRCSVMCGLFFTGVDFANSQRATADILVIVLENYKAGLPWDHEMANRLKNKMN